MREAELSMLQRLWLIEGTTSSSCRAILRSRMRQLGRHEEALQLKYRQVYFGHLKLNGEEHLSTLGAANNYAFVPCSNSKRYEEARSLLRKTMPVAQRVLGRE